MNNTTKQTNTADGAGQVGLDLDQLDRDLDYILTCLARDYKGAVRETVSDIRARVASVRRALQPGANAEPVARLHIRLEDDGLTADVEVLDGTFLQVEHSPVDVYLAPPADAKPVGKQAAMPELPHPIVTDYLAQGWAFQYEPETRYIALNHPRGGKQSICELQNDDKFGHAIAFLLNNAGAAPAEPEEEEEESAEDCWRRLALQFDGHRLQALGHLRALLSDPAKHAPLANAFLNAPPLSGDEVLAARIAALAGGNSQCLVPAADDAQDAERWRAFVGSARIKPQGSAGLNSPMPNHYAHMGLEIWTTFDRDYSAKLLAEMDADNALGRDWLTKYADVAVQARRAAMAQGAPTCGICERVLDNPQDPVSQNCGGDCLQCMADAGDPEAVAAIAGHRSTPT
jgi:hypothetical protein